VRGEDPPGPRGLEDLRGAVDPGPHVTRVERREPVADDRLAVATDADFAAFAVAQQHPNRHGARQPLHQREVLAGAAPRREPDEQVWVVGGGFVLETVA